MQIKYVLQTSNCGVLAAVLVLCSSMLDAAPQAELIPFWDKSDASNKTTINHSAWQIILDSYLDARHTSGVNRFNYAALAANAVVKDKLNGYLSYLQDLDPRKYNSAEQKAYWINFYNAMTVKIVVDHYPVKSITKIHKGWFAFGPWDDVRARVVGQKLTLNNIEHGILRPIWRDKRIHYAVNCASFGCPNLAAKVYTANNTEMMLENAAREYVNHSRGVRFDNGKLIISSIYQWYAVDFGGTDKNLILHLVQYANSDLQKRLQDYAGAIDDDYDWRLNQP